MEHCVHLCLHPSGKSDFLSIYNIKILIVCFATPTKKFHLVFYTQQLNMGCIFFSEGAMLAFKQPPGLALYCIDISHFPSPTEYIAFVTHVAHSATLANFSSTASY